MNNIQPFPQKNLCKKQPVGYFSKYWYVFPFIMAVIVVYIWFISSGTWTTWTSPTRYYANLAKGFQKGNLYTSSKPDPKLLTLQDPYDYIARFRAGIKPPIDISYYKGKYYLYWGPVPALLLVAVSPFYAGRVGDLQLVFVFVCGIFLMQSIFITFIWDRFFQSLPKWMLPISIFLVGLSSPVTFMLANFSAARIYEAAISGAQFFLMGGFLVAVTCIHAPFRMWKFIVTGLLLALAIGTRQTVVLSVGLVVTMLSYITLKSERPPFQKIKEISALASPLIIGGLCLGWYNWARFGSVTETGLYYQMNHGFVHYHTDKLFGYRYIFQNLYNYLLMPFRISPQFPFLFPELGNREEFLFSFSSPSIYSAQLITGLLYAVPFIIFAIVPLAALIFKKPPLFENSGEQGLFNWLTMTLGMTSLASFGFLLIFFWAAMRYAEDFMPFLTMLSVIGFWHGYSLLMDKPLARKIYAMFGGALASASIVVSTLLAISINDARFIFIRIFSSIQ